MAEKCSWVRPAPVRRTLSLTNSGATFNSNPLDWRIRITFAARIKWILPSAVFHAALVAGCIVVVTIAPFAAQQNGARSEDDHFAVSVWDGTFSTEQATRGKATYLDECSRCHAEGLGGTESGPALVGRDFVRSWSGKSAGDLFLRIRDSMPLDSPGTLEVEQVAEVVAFILKTNDFPAGQKPLSVDLAALKRIKIEAEPMGPPH